MGCAQLLWSLALAHNALMRREASLVDSLEYDLFLLGLATLRKGHGCYVANQLRLYQHPHQQSNRNGNTNRNSVECVDGSGANFTADTTRVVLRHRVVEKLTLRHLRWLVSDALAQVVEEAAAVPFQGCFDSPEAHEAVRLLGIQRG